MNLIIILIGSAVMTGLITMLTVDLLEDNGEQERTAKLEREITYLNHGSYGACPKPIFESLIKMKKKFPEIDIFKDDKIEFEKAISSSPTTLSGSVSFMEGNKGRLKHS